MFRAHGHLVAAFHTPSELLAVWGQIEPEVVFLDINLPEMDGWQLARVLRKQSAGPLMLITVTANGHPDDRLRSFEAGFDQYSPKPFDFNALLTLVNEITPS